MVFSQQEKQYAFTHFSTTNGLVSNSVFSIIQDKQGYIWLATVDGLQRYDGNRFLTFRHSSTNPHSIPSDFIVHLIMDKDGNLWFYSGQKIGFFDTRKFTFTPVPIEGEDVSHPYDIRFYGNAANGYAALYAYNKGIFIYDPDSKIFKQEISFKLSDKQHLYGIESIDNGRNYWIAAHDGLLVYDDETGNLNYRGHSPDSNFYINHLKDDTAITNFYGYKSDTLWYGSWPQLPYTPFIHTLDMKTREKKTFSISKLLNLGYVEVGGALFQANGRKWFYGRSFIAEYTGNDKMPFQLIPNEYTSEQSITFDRAYQMFEDGQHNIWVATDNGVFVFNPDMQVFSNYNLSRGPGKEGMQAAVTNACQLKNGNVLITTWGTGLFYYDNNFNALALPPELREFTKSYMIWCVHEHKKTGLIWMGMQGGEMAVYDPVTRKVDKLRDTAFRKSTIRQVTEDANGNLWFGMQSGSIVKWNMQAANGDIHRGYEVIKPRSAHYIQKMYTGRDGAIWVCHLDEGLYKYDPSTNRVLAHYTKNNLNNKGLSDNSVNDVYAYNDSILLIAGGALDVLNTKTNVITHISTENGLPSNTVLSIEADKDGILWLGMPNQLCRFDLQKKIFSTFNRRDGISYDLFNPAADYKLRDGRLIYLTDKNFIAFNPAAVTATAAPDNVVITKFAVGNTPLPVDSLSKFSTIDLKYDNTSVSIEFSTLNYTPQNKLHYLYMLDGIDKDWRSATNLNEAVYNYLPAGDYTFKVKAENTEGQQSSVTTLQLRVVPPFWKTWWFFGSFILLALAAFYWVDRERINKIQALQRVRMQIAKNLHKDINSTLNRINLLSEMAKIKADIDIERSKDYIEQISDKSRTMIDSMDDILWTLNPQNDSMEKTVLRMKEYAEAMQNTYLTNVIMEVDETVNQLKIDMKVRHELFLIFKKTLHSIAMNANHSESVINIDHTKKQLLIKIQNNEVRLSGLEAEQTISEISQRAELVNGELDFQNDSKGISLILSVAV